MRMRTAVLMAGMLLAAGMAGAQGTADCCSPDAMKPGDAPDLPYAVSADANTLRMKSAAADKARQELAEKADQKKPSF